MRGELARKQPVQVIKQEPARVVTVAGLAVIRDPLRTVVTQEVHRLYAEGRIEQDYRVGRVNGEWVAKVVYLPRRVSWVRRNRLKLTVAFLIAVSALALLAMVVKLLIMALPALLAIAAILAALFLLTRFGGGRAIEVTQKVRIRG